MAEFKIFNRLRWRITLSVTNLLAAVGQSAFGFREAERFLNANPPHDQVLPYVPVWQLISYSLNAPALILTNLIERSSTWRSFWGEQWLGKYWFRDVSTCFYVVLFLLWLWVGWRLDRRAETLSRTWAATLGNLLGTFLAFALVYVAVYLLIMERPTLRYAGGPAIPISALIWGVALLWYFSRILLRRGHVET